MTKSGAGGQAFDHINVIGNVTALAPEDESQDENEAEEEKERKGGEGEHEKDDVENSSPEEKRKGKATDIERLRLTLQKMLLGKCEKLKRSG